MILSIISKVAVEQSMDKVSGAINGITFLKVYKNMTCKGTKLILDSAATNHSIFNPDVLNNIHTKNAVLQQTAMLELVKPMNGILARLPYVAK